MNMETFEEERIRSADIDKADFLKERSPKAHTQCPIHLAHSVQFTFALSTLCTH